MMLASLLNLGFAGSSVATHTAEGLLAQIETDCGLLFLEEIDSTQLATDLTSAFFPSTAVGFAEDITIDGNTVRGMVETASYAGDRDGPRLLVKESDWIDGAYAHNAAIVMRTLSYTVKGVQPDGFGLVELVLEEA